MDLVGKWQKLWQTILYVTVLNRDLYLSEDADGAVRIDDFAILLPSRHLVTGFFECWRGDGSSQSYSEQRHLVAFFAAM